MYFDFNNLNNNIIICNKNDKCYELVPVLETNGTEFHQVYLYIRNNPKHPVLYLNFIPLSVNTPNEFIYGSPYIYHYQNKIISIYPVLNKNNQNSLIYIKYVNCKFSGYVELTLVKNDKDNYLSYQSLNGFIRYFILPPVKT